MDPEANLQLQTERILYSVTDVFYHLVEHGRLAERKLGTLEKKNEEVALAEWLAEWSPEPPPPESVKQDTCAVRPARNKTNVKSHHLEDSVQNGHFEAANGHCFCATGRRKTAVARVRMTAGTGQIRINGRSFEEYFPTRPLQTTVMKPMEVANASKTYDVSVNASGGGINGQAGAVRLAVSRALIQADKTLRYSLKVEGLLTRDPRMKERKKSGQPGARKRFQFSKR